MTTPFVDEQGTLHYSSWVKRGEMLCSRESLNPNDPENLYNYISAAGICPEDFGLKHPYTERFEGKTRAQLISQIVELGQTIESASFHGFM